MNLEDPRWEEWEATFCAVAEEVEAVPVTPTLHGAAHYLCLSGDNGLSPEEEFAELALMASQRENLKKVVIERDYWMDTILFIL